MTEAAGLHELRLIPGGSFLMGNDRARRDERPAHRVTLSRFWAAPEPVSNASYERFLRETSQEPPPFLEEPRFSAPDAPVVGVSWYDAVAYCRWLTSLSGRRCRLPTEAEREYAALGGLEGVDWPWGDDPPASRPELGDIAGLDRPHVPHEACKNGYGILCMADNVHEWCSDWYEAAYYERAPEQSPQGPTSGRRRASRGGSWRHAVKFNRISSRSSLDPGFRYNDYGFRVYADA